MTHPEDLPRARIREIQSERLRRLLGDVAAANPFWQVKFREAGVDATALTSVDDLPRLPPTTKADLVADHAGHPPYGSNLTSTLSGYSRMHQTSGTTGAPLRWLDTPASWDWFMDCWAQIYRIVGLTREDRLAFPFSFGPFVGFWAGFEGAARLGNLCLAGGGMSSAARLRLIAENAATVVCCTPTYALRLAEIAEGEGFDLANGSVRALIVAGEPGGGIAATRDRIERAWGARLFDHWGMTEIGSLAVECVENPGGLHLLETECIAEVLNAESLQPVAPGDAGELVITNLGRNGSPLIRYRTGDRVRVDPSRCPCGRELLRLDGGILGRTDDMVTIRGNNVYPSSLEAILREFSDVAEYRIEVRTDRAMQQLTVQIEPLAEVAADTNRQTVLVERISQTFKDRLNFQADVVAVPPDSLPRFELKGRRFVRVDTQTDSLLSS
ncbi:MAG: phenylacetate--CoA ligase family protein [Planctomycetaceae bacterium]